MNVTQFKYLRAVVAEGSFSKAAQALFVPPQAVSKAIRSLEEELGFALFARTGRSVFPTDVALRFAEQAEDAVRSFDDLEYFARGLGDSPEEASDIRLGIAEAASRCHVFSQEDFLPFRTEHRTARLRLEFLSNEMCASAVRSGVLDAAIILGAIEGDGLEHHRIGTVHPHAVMAGGHELAHRGRLVLDDLDGRRVAIPIDRSWTAPRLIELCRLNRIMPRFVDLAPSRATAERFVRQGGIVLMARENRIAPPPPWAVALPFEDGEGFSIPLNLACRKGGSEALARLYVYIATMARRNLEHAKPPARTA